MHQILDSTPKNVNYAVSELICGQLVAFPTETVYGLGGNAYSDASVAKIFQYKGRPQFNPVSVCYRDIAYAENDVELNNYAVLLAKHFLAGPMTLVLKRKPKSRLSWLCSAGQGTIGIRIPASSLALELLSALPFPLAAPSANKSSRLSPTTAQEVSDSLIENKDLTILDGGKCPLGIESTIVDVSCDIPEIVRIGAISAEEIEEKCGIHVKQSCPSLMGIKHYQLKKTIITDVYSANSDDALLAFGVPFENDCKYVLNLSPTKNLDEAAANFFSMLHELEKTKARRICVMPIPRIGMGIAINDKLRAAAR